MTDTLIPRATSVPSPPIPEVISGVNVMLMGGSGSGKTHSVATLCTAGLEVFVLSTEPGISEVLGNIPDAQLHWHYIPSFSPTWDELIDSANKVNTLTFKVLSDMSGINREKYRQFIDVYKTFANFKCDRCGKEFGAVDSWDANRAIVVDSLSGLSIMAMNLVVGTKPTKNPAEWGTAMDNLSRLIQKLCFDTRAHFVLTAHLEREVNEVTGSVQNMASTLGRKLAPVLPRFFSDVIVSERTGSTFTWSTAAPNSDTKTRNLSIGDKLTPSFVPLIVAWKAKQNKGKSA